MLLLITASALLCWSSSLAGDRPNIVVLLADDLGYGDLSCFGNRSFSTSHLDRLAASGARLTHHVAAAAVCAPSRTALLTGRYPVRTGMQESRGGPPVVRNVFGAGGLPQTERTFGRRLQDAGYRTQFVGKWHQGWSCRVWDDQCHGPREHGFQTFFGLPLTLQEEEDVDPPSRRERDGPFVKHVLSEVLRAGAEAGDGSKGSCERPSATKLWHLWLDMTRATYYDATPRREWWGHTLVMDKFLNHMLVRNGEIKSWPYQLVGLTQRLLDESQRFIRGQAARGDAPFLLVHSFLHPHTPLFTAPVFANASGHSRYADNVLEMDWAVGQLLDTLQEAGVADNTLVYFASDHGAHLELVGRDGQREGGTNAPFAGGKGQGGAEGGIRVPAMVRWPGRIPAGRAVDVPTSAMDLLPTLLDAAGVDDGDEDTVLDGVSMLPLLEGRSDAPTHRFLAHYCGDDIHAVRYAPETELGAVYKLRLAVPRYPDPEVEHCGVQDGLCSCYGEDVLWLPTPRLYELTTDPAERDPIPESDPRYGRIVPKMLELLKQHRQNVTVAPAQVARFELAAVRPELVPWDQLGKFRGLEWDMHGLDDWNEFIAGQTCPASGQGVSEHCVRH
ncbi:Steryl-sulfatase [Amphibalanus amphitrite]|uniref:Steryl-sulfatase n=2 Tax=Amphibalanus amphitrite TaxID=1232801 RepID=A0A6A4WWB4_AMPAM|nr:Steryl-sulfatase [Amphibalanus amphitrite]